MTTDDHCALGAFVNAFVILGSPGNQQLQDLFPLEIRVSNMSLSQTRPHIFSQIHHEQVLLYAATKGTRTDLLLV